MQSARRHQGWWCSGNDDEVEKLAIFVGQQPCNLTLKHSILSLSLEMALVLVVLFLVLTLATTNGDDEYQAFDIPLFVEEIVENQVEKSNHLSPTLDPAPAVVEPLPLLENPIVDPEDVLIQPETVKAKRKVPSRRRRPQSQTFNQFNDVEGQPDGSYEFNYGDGFETNRKEKGYVKFENGRRIQVVEGSYSYVAPNGKVWVFSRTKLLQYFPCKKKCNVSIKKYFLVCKKKPVDFDDELKIGDVRYDNMTKITIKVQLFWRLPCEM